MKDRKAILLEELEETSRKLIDVQFRLDAGKRKPVITSSSFSTGFNNKIFNLLAVLKFNLGLIISKKTWVSIAIQSYQ
jgi:hypothetical protein